MRYLACLSLAVVLAVAVPRPAASAGEQSFRVGGAVEHPGEWTIARITGDLAGSVQMVRYTMKGEEHTARCVPLWALLQAAQVRIDPQVKNHRVGFAIVVRARDGYVASFSLAELAPDIGDQKVWLVFEVDGKPLSQKEAPARLVVPAEGKVHYLRWISAISMITVVDGAKAGEPPAAAK